MNLTRRDWLAAAPALAGAALAAAPATAPAQSPDRPAGHPFLYGLNTSTLQGHKLTIVEEIEIAAKAGYQGLEPWVRELDQHVKSGGSLKDLGQRTRDRGLSVESAIGFFDWAVDDDARREKGLEEARRSMELVARIGGKRVAAPPVGVTDRSDIDPRRLAERYRKLCELGKSIGVVPELELWGFSKTLGRLPEVVQVAVAAAHPDACVLLDVYHMYKGGSDVQGMALLNGAALPVIHFNDYPAAPPRETITDAHRVYPGDGIAPIAQVVRILRDIRFQGMLSLELFNRDYWKQDALEVARTGLEKMRAAVRRGLSE